MTDIRYISTKEAAGIMGLSTRRVVGLCNAGKLEGALRKGRNWKVPVILFTRPRRFGKTLALDMLKTFFEKTKEDTSIYFKDKQIWACGEKYQKMQGAFPVIYITFKDAKFSDWASTYAAIKNVIRDEFMRHDELLQATALIR